MTYRQKAFHAVLLFLSMLLSAIPVFGVPSYSTGPEIIGEEVLDGLVIGQHAFMIRVASNGGTDKNSFSVAVKKEHNISLTVPNYLLTITRKTPDSGKAILKEKIVLAFDMQKDLGISGNYSYSITNPVFSTVNSLSDGAQFSSDRKQTAGNIPVINEMRPQPLDSFVMDHEYFTCSIPTGWKTQERDPQEDEKRGIFELLLTKSDKAKPEDGSKYFFPDPLLYAGFYRENNSQKKTYQSLVREYEELAQKNTDSDKTRYSHPEKTTFKNREATTLEYVLSRKSVKGALLTSSYRLKARVMVIKARDGFFVIAYKSPEEFYDRYLPVFKAFADSFAPTSHSGDNR
jgi:hypothetical protein